MTTKPIIFLAGERVYLRALEPEDLHRGQVWINDPDVRRWLRTSFPVDSMSEQKWHEGRDRSELPSTVTMAIVLCDNDRHIGSLSLYDIDWVHRCAESGMIIGEADCRGKGYSVEAKALLLEYAFNTLGLNRVESFVCATNAASLAGVKRSGYQEEGRARKKFWREGQWIDEVRLAILADDWRAMNAGKTS